MSISLSCADIFRMECSENDTSLEIKIPVVAIPKSEGDIMQKSIGSGRKGKSRLYVSWSDVLIIVYKQLVESYFKP